MKEHVIWGGGNKDIFINKSQEIIKDIQEEYPNIRIYDYINIREKEEDIEKITKLFPDKYLGSFLGINKSYKNVYTNFASSLEDIKNNNIENFNVEKKRDKLYNLVNKYDKNELLIRSLYHLHLEQKYYFENRILQETDTYNTWFITYYIKNNLYGGIFLFRNNNNPNLYKIQGITKYYGPVITKIFHKNIEIEKLNTLLIPVVEKFVANLGGIRIYVDPMEKQGELLEKYYGFVKTDEKNIQGFDTNYGKEFNNYYIKEI